jgi:hypothetical protein
MDNTSIVGILIENIRADQELLVATETKISEAKEEKQAITDRLKEYRRDVSVLLKYADEKHRKQIEELGFDFSESERGINPVASVAFDIILRAKENQMTNGALYNAYVATFKNKDDAFDYTQFNIKCRSLFNTQRLLRTKGKDPKSSRDDLISLNGRVEKIPEASKNKK